MYFITMNDSYDDENGLVGQSMENICWIESENDHKYFVILLF